MAGDLHRLPLVLLCLFACVIMCRPTETNGKYLTITILAGISGIVIPVYMLLASSVRITEICCIEMRDLKCEIGF